MKKLIAIIFALLVPATAMAVLEQYQPGFRLIDGSQLNKMVDVVNGLVTDTANAVLGVSSGYKIARGATTLDGSNPTPVATGLTTVVSCNVSIATSVAPGVSTSLVTGVISTTTLNIYGWKPTDATNNTLIASTGTDPVQWICVGT